MNRLQEMEDTAEEINNQLTGDFLTENPATTVSSVAPLRYLKYHFKDLSEEQRLSIRDEQVRFSSAALRLFPSRARAPMNTCMPTDGSTGVCVCGSEFGASLTLSRVSVGFHCLLRAGSFSRSSQRE